MMNSRGWSPTWPSTGGGAAGGAQPRRHPALLLLEHYDNHDHAPFLLSLRTIPLPQGPEEEGHAVEKKPSSPPLDTTAPLSSHHGE